MVYGCAVWGWNYPLTRQKHTFFSLFSPNVHLNEALISKPHVYPLPHYLCWHAYLLHLDLTSSLWAEIMSLATGPYWSMPERHPHPTPHVGPQIYQHLLGSKSRVERPSQPSAHLRPVCAEKEGCFLVIKLVWVQHRQQDWRMGLLDCLHCLALFEPVSLLFLFIWKHFVTPIISCDHVFIVFFALSFVEWLWCSGECCLYLFKVLLLCFSKC